MISIPPHKEYEYNNNQLLVTDDNGNVTKIEVKQPTTDGPKNEHVLDYFAHDDDYPLKYCVSKNTCYFY